MPNRPIDPARLEGEALRRWYVRSNADVDREKKAAEAEEYDEFFGSSARDPNDEKGQFQRQTPYSAFLDRRSDGPDQRARLIPVGNPENPRLIREWERREGRTWPTDPATGRKYDVHHKKALADGGTNTLDNIEPLHPDAHRAEHITNGDHSRWGKRPGIARAFGGTVQKSLGPLSLLSDFTGILSGRIRHDSFDNFVSDMMGFPSEEDRRRAFEAGQRQRDPNWKPGDGIWI